MWDAPQTGCAPRLAYICIWCEQARIEWSGWVICIVACCHSVKLCELAPWVLRSQQYTYSSPAPVENFRPLRTRRNLRNIIRTWQGWEPGLLRPNCEFWCIWHHILEIKHSKGLHVHQGWGTYLLSRAAPIADYRWQAANDNWFYPKILPLLYVTMRDGGLYLWHPTLSRPSCLSWSFFVLTRFCILNWVTKILMRAISNVHACRRLPTPDVHCRQKVINRGLYLRAVGLDI